MKVTEDIFPPGAIVGGWATEVVMNESKMLAGIDEEHWQSMNRQDRIETLVFMGQVILGHLPDVLFPDTAQPQEVKEGEIPLASPCYWCTNCGSDECVKCGPDEQWRYYRP